MSVTYTETLTTTVCCSCGIHFAVPPRWLEERRKNAKTFYCPNGHDLFFGESEADKLRKQLARENSRRLAAEDQAAAAERSKSALKGQLTKAKKRINNGVCPHCNRYFENVNRHMTSQHKEEVNESGH